MVASLTLQHLMCAGLWCLVEGDTSCRTKLDPPLDGTECGADKVTITPSFQHSQQAPSHLDTEPPSVWKAVHSAQEPLKHP